MTTRSFRHGSFFAAAVTVLLAVASGCASEAGSPGDDDAPQGPEATGASSSGSPTTPGASSSGAPSSSGSSGTTSGGTTPAPPPPVDPATVGLGKLSKDVVDAAIAAPLIRFNRAQPGGAYTNGAWFGGASVALALASFSGDTSADARLLEQMRYSITGGNEPCANGGYPAQHERHATGMFAIARLTPRVWNQLSAAEQAKVDLVMKATLVGSAFTTSDNNPFIKANTQQYSLDGDANLNRGWNPNYREGMIGGVLVGMVYFGGAAATHAVLDGYDHAAFVQALGTAGLSNEREIFDWKAKNPSSKAPSGAQIQAAVKDYTFMGKTLQAHAEIYTYLLEDTYGAKVNAGLNNGAGINGAGKIVSGADTLPNKGALGMLKEFDANDAGGARSSAVYAFDGYRPHMTNLLTLVVGGYIKAGSPEVAAAKARLPIGNADLWYKIERGYLGYAKGQSQGEAFDMKRAASWGFTYNRGLWEQGLAPFLK